MFFTIRPPYSEISGSITCERTRNILSRTPASSSAIIRLYPTTSSIIIAASRLCAFLIMSDLLLTNRFQHSA